MNRTQKRWSSKRGHGAGVKWLIAHANYMDDDCLIWPFSRDTKGYGQVGIMGLTWRAHRYMCQLVNGPPPTPKHQASHECGNGSKGCCNPRHLSWKTNGENQRDKRKHGTHFNGGTGRKGKLTKEQIAEIQALRGVVPIMKLAKRYGVKRGTIDRWHRIARQSDLTTVQNEIQ